MYHVKCIMQNVYICYRRRFSGWLITFNQLLSILHMLYDFVFYILGPVCYISCANIYSMSSSNRTTFQCLGRPFSNVPEFNDPPFIDPHPNHPLALVLFLNKYLFSWKSVSILLEFYPNWGINWRGRPSTKFISAKLRLWCWSSTNYTFILFKQALKRKLATLMEIYMVMSCS